MTELLSTKFHHTLDTSTKNGSTKPAAKRTNTYTHTHTVKTCRETGHGATAAARPLYRRDPTIGEELLQATGPVSDVSVCVCEKILGW